MRTTSPRPATTSSFRSPPASTTTSAEAARTATGAPVVSAGRWTSGGSCDSRSAAAGLVMLSPEEDVHRRDHEQREQGADRYAREDHQPHVIAGDRAGTRGDQ